MNNQQLKHRFAQDTLLVRHAMDAMVKLEVATVWDRLKATMGYDLMMLEELREEGVV